MRTKKLPPAIKYSEILQIVGDVTGIHPNVFLSKSRRKDLVYARYLLILALLREKPDWTHEKFREALNMENVKGITGVRDKATGMIAKCKFFERNHVEIRQRIKDRKYGVVSN